MLRTKKLIGLILVASAAAVGLFAQSDVYMKIQTRGFQPVALHIPPFASQSVKTAQDVRGVIRNDLDFSGFFRVSVEDFFPAAVVRLEGQMEVKDETIRGRFALFDIESARKIFEEIYEEPVEAYRRLAHRISDDVIQNLIGDYGVSTSQLAFVHKSNKTSTLVVMDYDGCNIRTVVSNRALNLSPAFSPDGKRLVFTSYATGNPDLFLCDLSSGQTGKFSQRKGLHISPSWSPDGKALAYAMMTEGNSDIYVISSHGGTPKRITSGPAIDCAPSWSPDGREIAFTSDRSGSPQIFIMDADGGNVRRLTYSGSYNDSPSWSPRGDLIAYVTRDRGFRICTMDVTGGNFWQISKGPGNQEDPCWSPDGFFIAYASSETGSWNIYITSWDGKRTRQLTKTGGFISPAWSPRFSR